MASKAPARTTGMFSTHRGKFVKRLLWALFAGSFALMILNGMMNPSTDEADGADDPEVTEVVRADPKVEPAPVNPFTVREKVEPITVPESGTGENSLFQSAISIAGEGAVRYATYSHQQTPDAYVALIPKMKPESAKALTEAAEANWPEIEIDQVTASGAIRGIQPQMVAFDTDTGSASVSVSVAQTVKTRDGEFHFSRSYLVQLVRAEGEDGPWQIVRFGTQ